MTTLEIIGLTWVTMATFSGLAALPFLVWDYFDKGKQMPTDKDRK